MLYNRLKIIKNISLVVRRRNKRAVDVLKVAFNLMGLYQINDVFWAYERKREIFFLKRWVCQLLDFFIAYDGFNCVIWIMGK